MPYPSLRAFAAMIGPENLNMSAEITAKLRGAVLFLNSRGICNSLRLFTTFVTIALKNCQFVLQDEKVATSCKSSLECSVSSTR